MTTCSRCGRTLFRDPVLLGGMKFGPRCASMVTGSKPKRRSLVSRLPRVDKRQQDLFGETRP